MSKYTSRYKHFVRWKHTKPILWTYLFVCLRIPLNKSGILGGSVLLCLVDLLKLACMQQTDVGKRKEWVGEEYKKPKCVGTDVKFYRSNVPTYPVILCTMKYVIL